jgi:hypothetical protein
MLEENQGRVRSKFLPNYLFWLQGESDHQYLPIIYSGSTENPVIDVLPVLTPINQRMLLNV